MVLKSSGLARFPNKIKRNKSSKKPNAQLIFGEINYLNQNRIGAKHEKIKYLKITNQVNFGVKSRRSNSRFSKKRDFKPRSEGLLKDRVKLKSVNCIGSESPPEMMTKFCDFFRSTINFNAVLGNSETTFESSFLQKSQVSGSQIFVLLTLILCAL